MGQRFSKRRRYKAKKQTKLVVPLALKSILLEDIKVIDSELKKFKDLFEDKKEALVEQTEIIVEREGS